MQSKVYIFRANSQDISSLSSIEAACFSDAWSEKALLSQLESEYALTLVAKDADGNICGYISGGLTPPEAEIFRVATLPERRRAGVGKALLAEFLSITKEKDCRDYFIEVRESNTPARSLYASFGFSEIARRRAYYSQPKEDAIILSLKSDANG